LGTKSNFINDSTFSFPQIPILDLGEGREGGWFVRLVIDLSSKGNILYTLPYDRGKYENFIPEFFVWQSCRLVKVGCGYLVAFWSHDKCTHIFLHTNGLGFLR
jgi:hypothetical protein